MTIPMLVICLGLIYLTTFAAYCTFASLLGPRPSKNLLAWKPVFVLTVALVGFSSTMAQVQVDGLVVSCNLRISHAEPSNSTVSPPSQRPLFLR
jgi:hypothetical protein